MTPTCRVGHAFRYTFLRNFNSKHKQHIHCLGLPLFSVKFTSVVFLKPYSLVQFKSYKIHLTWPDKKAYSRYANHSRSTIANSLLVIKITCMNLYLFWFKIDQNFELYCQLYTRLLYIRLALEVTMKRMQELRVL